MNPRLMDSRQLRFFSVLAEICHFGQAAEALHVSPSALSQAIRQLESDLGAVLVNRSTRHVSLTPAGVWLQREAEQILGRMTDVASGIRRFSEGSTGLIRLGMTGTAAFSYLPRIARLLKQALPDVAVSVNADMLALQQCEALMAGTIDLGFLRPPPTIMGVKTTPFVRERLFLAVPEGHRLASEVEVDVADLRDEAWVAYIAQGSFLNREASRLCHRAGFEPRREHVCNSISVLLSLVAAGLGVAVVPGGVRSLHMDGVVLRELPETREVEMAMALRADLENPTVHAAVRALTPRSSSPPL